MIPVHFQVVGEEDYMLDIAVAADGSYRYQSGTYTSEEPRTGRLEPEQERALIDAIRALGTPRPHSMPEGVEAFEASLTVGEPGEEITYRFWEGALEEDQALRRLVRLLETL